MCLKPLAISCLSGHLSACIPPVTGSSLPTKYHTTPPFTLWNPVKTELLSDSLGLPLGLLCPLGYQSAHEKLFCNRIPRSAPARRHLALLAVSTAQNAQRAHSFPFSGSLRTGHLFFLFFFFQVIFSRGPVSDYTIQSGASPRLHAHPPLPAPLLA